MPPLSDHFLELYDAAGTLRGVRLSPELWVAVKDRLLPVIENALCALDPAMCPGPAEKPEPLEEWETLLAYWDFTYPPGYDVSCAHCGASTPDWRQDDPRKFRMRTASLGGLVTFQCQACKSLVLKKHFKKHLTVECQPYVDRA